MIKTFHEAPISVFDDVQTVTDGDYALVHLLDLNPTYLTKFKQAVNVGREVILDNSIFELGTSFEELRYLHWINELNPTWYILPDVLEDCSGTIQKAISWKYNFQNKVTTSSKVIGVIQGKTYAEFVECYEAMNSNMNVDMLAISFDYSYYTNTIKHPNRLVSWMLGRITLLSQLYADGIINTNKPHHLLGCSLPQEGLFYRNFPWIHSIDTSNPVVHAIKHIRYKTSGLWKKESQKLHTFINDTLDEQQKDDMLFNIKKFRSYWNQQ